MGSLLQGNMSHGFYWLVEKEKPLYNCPLSLFR